MSEPRHHGDPFLAAPTAMGRAFAFLRFLTFVLLFCLFTVAAAAPFFWPAARWHVDGSDDPEWTLAIQVAAEALGALAATAVMARWSGRRLGDFGFGGRDRLRHFGIGIATGVTLVALLLLGLSLAGAVSLAPAGATVAAAARHGAFYALLMLGIGFAEESFSRGYALVALAQSLSFWPAAAVTGALFGLVHAVNDGETAIGLASAALFGVILAWSYRRTGALWFACGIHAGWDYAQSFVFGVPDSGVTLPGGLFRSSFAGPDWLTGGSAGPEGSVLMLAALAAIVLVIRRISPPGAANVDAALPAMAATTAPR